MHLSGCFTPHLRFCGSARRAQCISSNPIRTAWACCAHWDNIRRLFPSQTGFAMGNASAHFWMICMSLQILNELWIATRSREKNCGTCAKVLLHHGKTAVWNRGGEVPPDIGCLERAARLGDPSARVWRGGIHSIPEESGILICVNSKSKLPNTKHCCRESLTSRTYSAPGWSLLFCAASRANFFFRTVSPSLSHAFAAQHMMRRSGAV